MPKGIISVSPNASPSAQAAVLAAVAAHINSRRAADRSELQFIAAHRVDDLARVQVRSFVPLGGVK